jgi:hypothetical protein
LATSDQPFEQALLYLHAAGHDTGADTRARLQQFLGAHRDENPTLETAVLLDKIPRWFDLSGSDPYPQKPIVARASIGYPNG